MSGRILIIALFLVNVVGATSIDVTAPACPDAFVGVVEKITDSETPFNSLAKQSVTFGVQELIRGDLGQSVTIKSLKYGPMKFAMGQQYLVELRNFRICRVTKL